MAGALFQAWLDWAQRIIREEAQLPYRVAMIAFVLGSVLAWFAAKEWYTQGDEEDGDEAEECGNG